MVNEFERNYRRGRMGARLFLFLFSALVALAMWLSEG